MKQTPTEAPPIPTAASPAIEAHIAGVLDLLDSPGDSGAAQATYAAVTVHWEDGAGHHTINASRSHGD